MQILEVVEDVRPEPRFSRRRLALEGERPVTDAGAPGDELSRLEQLVAVGVALLEDACGERVRSEHDVRSRSANSIG